MATHGTRFKKLAMLAVIALAAVSNSGCKFGGDMLVIAWDFAEFFGTTPIIPVSPYYSQLIEDAYSKEERYDRVPVLDPVEGENAPIFCMDPPSPDEVMRALPEQAAGGKAFMAETAMNNVRITVEPIVDRVDDCRFYPLVGPAKLHHCHYKCTVYYDKIIRSDWPIPFKHIDETTDVVYIDHDHLIRCAGPVVPQ